MTLLDQKLETMPDGNAVLALGVSSDGTPVLYRPSLVLNMDGVPSSITGTLSETVLGTVTIPAGAMQLNGGLRLTSLWSMTNSANVKRIRVRLGGIGGTSFFDASVTTNTGYVDLDRIILNRNSASVQIGRGLGASGTGVTSSAAVVGAVDTSVDQDLVFTALLANTGETITLESILVELLAGAS